MRILPFLFLLALLHVLKATPDNESETHRKVLKLMGTRFELIAVSSDDTLAWEAINAGIAEIQRIEDLISSWDPNSQTSAINRNAGVKAVEVDEELFELIRRSKKVSGLTDGIFDISYASLDRVWHYDGSMTKLPSKETLAASISKINYQHILLNKPNSTVRLKDAGMKIGFGAIGKGYAANRAKAVMQAKGIKNGVVNAAGDLLAWGTQADGTDWRISILDPNNKEQIFCWLSIRDQAVVTSGNYEKYVEIDGKRYGHIIHPKTGIPVSGLKSVTIVCPDAELADALATSVFIMGAEDGLALINRMKGVEGLLIDDDNDFHTSKNIQIDLVSTVNNLKGNH